MGSRNSGTRNSGGNNGAKTTAPDAEPPLSLSDSELARAIYEFVGNNVYDPQRLSDDTTERAKALRNMNSELGTILEIQNSIAVSKKKKLNPVKAALIKAVALLAVGGGLYGGARALKYQNDLPDAQIDALVKADEERRSHIKPPEVLVLRAAADLNPSERARVETIMDLYKKNGAHGDYIRAVDALYEMQDNPDFNRDNVMGVLVCGVLKSPDPNAIKQLAPLIAHGHAYQSRYYVSGESAANARRLDEILSNGAPGIKPLDAEKAINISIQVDDAVSAVRKADQAKDVFLERLKHCKFRQTR